MATFTASTGTDMAAWDLSDLVDGDPVTNTATDWKVAGDTGFTNYLFTGTALTYGGGGNPLPDGGTIDSFKMKISGTLQFTLNGSIDAATLSAFLVADDLTGLQGEWFKGADTFNGSTGNDRMFGYKGADEFNIGNGGDDWCEGGAGDDTFNVNGALSSLDIFYGGGGLDTLNITGTNFYDFTSVGLLGVETVTVNGGFNQLGFLKQNVAPGGFTVDGSALGSAEGLSVQASGVNNAMNFLGGRGADLFNSGSANDNFYGGRGDDQVTGGKGADILEGGDNNDSFVYLAANHSPGIDASTIDTILDFNAAKDRFYLTYAINDVNAPVTAGSLSFATFAADLEATIDTGAELGKLDAVLYAPDSGDFAGATFCIIDVNNKIGYQTNKDLVIWMLDASGLGGFDEDNFDVIG
jgi:Ca2+-binding RTX toxin-like protein